MQDYPTLNGCGVFRCMTKSEIKTEILLIQQDIGITNIKMAEHCGISKATYDKCRSDKAEKNWFSLGNLERLEIALKDKLGKIGNPD